jgi:hypothetical protein
MRNWMELILALCGVVLLLGIAVYVTYRCTKAKYSLTRSLLDLKDSGADFAYTSLEENPNECHPPSGRNCLNTGENETLL